MGKYVFSVSERYAIWVVHAEKCYICKKLVEFDRMQVDHVIPEALLDKPLQLKLVLSELGRPKDFRVNSFDNWLPSCQSCNAFKNNTIFESSPLIQLILQRAAEKSEAARLFAETTITKQRVSKAIGTLKMALEQDIFNEETLSAIEPLIDLHLTHREITARNEPIVLAPLFQILSQDSHIVIVKGPYGIGGRPSSPSPHSGWDCPNCGTSGAWNGTRCVICGHMDDD